MHFHACAHGARANHLALPLMPRQTGANCVGVTQGIKGLRAVQVATLRAPIEASPLGEKRALSPCPRYEPTAFSWCAACMPREVEGNCDGFTYGGRSTRQDWLESHPHSSLMLHACSYSAFALLTRRYPSPMAPKRKALTKRKHANKWGQRENVSKLTTGRVAAKQQVQRPCPHAV